MAISYQSGVSTALNAGNSYTTSMSSHAAEDLIVAFVFRDGSTTLPTIPGNWLYVSGTGTSCCFVMAWKKALSGSEVTGTWTNATGISIAVYRKASDEEWGIPFAASTIRASSGTTLTYPDSSLIEGAYTGEWYIRAAGARAATNLTTNTPSSWTARTGTATETRIMDTNTNVGSTTANNIGGDTQAVSGSSGWICVTSKIGVIAKPSGASIWCVGASARNGTTGNSWVKDGDLVVVAAVRGNLTAASLPAGWTSQTTGTATLTTSTRIGYKVMTSDSPQGSTFFDTWTNAEQIYFWVFRKTGLTGDWDITHATTTGSGTTVTFPNLVAVPGADKYMFVRHHLTAGNSSGTMSGWTKRSRGDGTGMFMFDTQRDVATDADTVGADSATQSTGAWRSWTLGIGNMPPLLPGDPIADVVETWPYIESTLEWDFFVGSGATFNLAEGGVVSSSADYLTAGGTAAIDGEWDLTGGEVTFEAISLSNTPAVTQWAGIGYNPYGLSLLGPNTAISVDETYTVQAILEGAPVGTTHTWSTGERWRIREASGTIYFDYCLMSNTSWTNFASGAWTVAPTNVKPVLDISGGVACWGPVNKPSLLTDVRSFVAETTDAFSSGSVPDAAKFTKLTATGTAVVGSGKMTLTDCSVFFKELVRLSTGGFSDSFLSFQAHTMSTDAQAAITIAGIAGDTDHGFSLVAPTFGFKWTGATTVDVVVEGEAGGLPITHAPGNYYRIRSVSFFTVQLMWEYSTNGYTWIPWPGMTPNPLNLGAGGLGYPSNGLEAAFTQIQFGGAAGGAQYDNINLYVTSPKVELLTDNFATEDSAKWTGYGADPDMANVVSGQLVLGDIDEAGQVWSYSTWSLADSYAAWEVADSGIYFAAQVVQLPTNPFFGIGPGFYYDESIDTLLRAIVYPSEEDPVGSVTYNAVSHKYLRVRETSGTLYWETSANGFTWSTLASAATGDICTPQMGVQIIGQDSYKMDNFNLMPAGGANTTNFFFFQM